MALDTEGTFGQQYDKLVSFNDQTPDTEFLETLEPFTNDFQKVFNFSIYKQVTKENNEKVFNCLSKRLSSMLLDIDSQQSEKLILIILCTIRVLLRSKSGINALLTKDFYDRLMKCLSHFERNKDIQTQIIACIVNMASISLQGVCKIAFENKFYNNIISFLMNVIDKNKETTVKEKESLKFLSIHCLFYLTANLENKSIANDIYKNDKFFRWIFELYLEKSKYFETIEYWQMKEEKNEKENKFLNSYWRNDCSLINQICRLLFNFTLVENKVLQYKLDKFEKEFQFAVVNRTCDILSLPLNYDIQYGKYAPAKASNKLTVKEYQKQIKNWEKCKSLCDEPSLISVKLNLCNVAMYNGDIIGMNLKAKCCQPLCELLDFRAIVTRDGYRNQETLCPMLMFLKDVSSFNSTFQKYLKEYIFKKDARVNNNDSTDSSDDSDNNNDNNGKPDIKSKLDKVPKGGTTLRNLFISYMTSVSFSVKTAMGEFFLKVCDDSPDETVRLVGFGAAIGHMVNRGIPGFSHMADQGVNLEQMAALKRKMEKEKMAKKQESKKGNNGNDSNDKNDKNKNKNDKANKNTNEGNEKTTQPLNEQNVGDNTVSFYQFLNEQLEKEKKEKKESGSDNATSKEKEKEKGKDQVDANAESKVESDSPAAQKPSDK